LLEPSVTQDYVTSLLAVALGVAGALLARRAFASGHELVPEASIAHRVLSHKLYFDEAYDALFSRPAQALAVRLRERFEGPVIHRSLDEVGRGTQQAARLMASGQTGLLRSYVLAIAATVVVLAVVFLVVR
jgi:NADH:ubiquinone oxidoreductase subunit 5 (subunit L)/multisubunit Na+/H+ antiporter MnhA subunit